MPAVPIWEELPPTLSVSVRVANKGVAARGLVRAARKGLSIVGQMQEAGIGSRYPYPTPLFLVKSADPRESKRVVLRS